MLTADCCIIFSSFVVASILSLGLLACILFQQPKINSPSPLYAQGYHHWGAWDLLPDCLARQVG
jgi:hypothetical protein